MGNAIGAIMGAGRAILLGRKTYDLFAPVGTQRRAAEHPAAPFMNDKPKYVVSSTMSSGDWRNMTVLGSYSADVIRDLKQHVDGGIYVSGSGTLVRAMLRDGLVDELHLFVYAVTLGAGQRLFADTGGLHQVQARSLRVLRQRRPPSQLPTGNTRSLKHYLQPGRSAGPQRARGIDPPPRRRQARNRSRRAPIPT